MLALVMMCPLVLAPPKQLSREQARQLVLKALEAQRYPIESPKFTLLDNEAIEKEYFPDFYFFESYYDTETRLAATGH